MDRKTTLLPALLLLFPFLSMAQHPVVPVASFPFGLVQNHVIVQAEVNGKTVPFAIDTKTKDMYLYGWAIDSLGLKMKPKDKYEGGRDSLVIGKTRPGTIHLANTSFEENKKVWVYENTHYFNFLGQRIAGVIGSSLFDAFVVRFDFENDTLQLYDPRTFTPNPRMKPVSLRKSRGGVLAEMKFKFADGSVEDQYVMLSTATDNVITAKYKIGKRYGYFEKGYGRHRAFGRELPGHFFKASRSYHTKLGFWGDIFHDVPLTVSHEDKAFAPKHWFDHIMVGTHFLSRYNITFDYNKKTAYFEKHDGFTKTVEKNRSGLILTYSFESNQYVVNYVIPGSPAAEADIQKGDVLVSIYKKPAYSLTLDEIEAMLMENSNKVELHMEREDTTFRVIFRLSEF